MPLPNVTFGPCCFMFVQILEECNLLNDIGAFCSDPHEPKFLSFTLVNFLSVTSRISKKRSRIYVPAFTLFVVWCSKLPNWLCLISCIGEKNSVPYIKSCYVLLFSFLIKENFGLLFLACMGLNNTSNRKVFLSPIRFLCYNCLLPIVAQLGMWHRVI